jgi:hypothetical protein
MSLARDERGELLGSIETRSLLEDDGGQVATSTLGFSLTWFLIFSTFLMDVQLGQLFPRRDVVDHAAALAADSATKTYCARGENASASEQEALRAIDPLLVTATSQKSCGLTVRPSGGSADPGAKPLDVTLECSFDCKIPVAAQVMCKQGKVSFASKLKTVALGCDGKGG